MVNDYMFNNMFDELKKVLLKDHRFEEPYNVKTLER